MNATFFQPARAGLAVLGACALLFSACSNDSDDTMGGDATSHADAAGQADAAGTADGNTSDDMGPQADGVGGDAGTTSDEGADTGAGPTEPLEIAGEWDDNFGGMATITNTSWPPSTIVKYDNDQNFAITQSPADDEFTPNQFAKVVWTEPAGGSFFGCFVEFGQETAEAAEATEKTADDSDPENGGCGGFSWTKYTRR